MAEMMQEKHKSKQRPKSPNPTGVKNPGFDADENDSKQSATTKNAKNMDAQESKERKSDEIEAEIAKFLEEDREEEAQAARKSDESLGIVATTAEDVKLEEVTETKIETIAEEKPATSSTSKEPAKLKKSEQKASLLESSLMMNVPRLMMMFDKGGEGGAGGEEGGRDMKIQANNYLILAIRNDSPHLVERLLERSSAISIYTALLFSINLGRDHITKVFLAHPKYETVRQVMKLTKRGTLAAKAIQIDDTDQHLAEEGDDTVLTADVTPLMLAAQKNQFEVVQNLMALGERIHEPHSGGCKCEECTGQTDELREAKTRLSTYKSLCSDAYLVQANTDPIFIAFELGQKLRRLANEEKHYKADYLALAIKCGDLCGRLLDRVRDDSELDTLLNEKSGSGLSAYDSLARLKLAIHYREKKFVAHPACQKKLASLWMGSLNPSWVETPWKVLIFMVCLTACYPFLAIAYWIYPKSKLGHFLRIPLVKFTASTCSYIVFLALLIGYSATEERHAGETIGQYYNQYENYTLELDIYDIKMRYNKIGIGTILLCVWLVGMIWDNIKKLYHEKFMYFTENTYNILDFVMLFLYIMSFAFRFASFGLVEQSIKYFKDEQSWVDLTYNNSLALSNFYWLDADRSTWRVSDPAILAEALFGIASLLSICKLTHVFTISERIGPLLISLARMLQDVFAFMVIFVFIIAAFVVAFHNLFWYFYPTIDGDAQNSFGGLSKIIEQCFWSIFGLVEMEDNMFDTSSEVTTVTAHIIFAFYNWMMVIILINMLIAMMSRSYEFIAAMEDVEWKFARTKLFLEYIRDDCTLTVPFNLVPTWKGVYLLSKRLSNDWCRRCAGRKPKPQPSALTGNKFLPRPSTTQSSWFFSPNVNGKLGSTLPMSPERGKSLQKWADSLEQKNKEKKSSKEPSEEYKEVIAEVVKRFIQHNGKGRAGDETGEELPDQIQKDMSSLRQAIISDFLRQTSERAEIRNQVSQIYSDLGKSREAFTRQHAHLKSQSEARSDEMKTSLETLEEQIKTLAEYTTETLAEMQTKMSEHIRDTHTSMEILKDGVFRLCADVTMLRGGGAVSRDVFLKNNEPSQEAANTSDPRSNRPVGARLSVTRSHISGDKSGGSTAYGEFGPITAKARKVAKDP